MPLMSVWSRNADLNSNYGSQHAAQWPDTIRVRLFTFDPRIGGEEISATTVVDGVAVANGYQPVVVDNTDAVFPPAAGGIKSSEPIDFGTSSHAWPDDATWAQLENPANGAWLDGVSITDVNVTDPGFGVRVVLEITTDELTE